MKNLIFKKKYCCVHLNLGPLALKSSTLPLDQAVKSQKVAVLDGVDNKHPHCKSIVKYVIVNRFKSAAKILTAIFMFLFRNL